MSRPTVPQWCYFAAVAELLTVIAASVALIAELLSAIAVPLLRLWS
ncbi:MAG: hypothetical protein J6Y72_01455 [Bacteroidales bacterium]|nr:hypothetical protein [Bacteroidales bacterium]MBR6249771.1 hypothetical protein [Bacteroidales bacterium]